MAKTVSRRRTVPNEETVLFLQFLTAQREEVEAKRRREAARDRLVEWVREDGHHEVDEEKGHLLHTMADEINFFGQQYTGFMHQRKAGGEVFLEDKAEELCQEKGFDPDDYTTRYVDQDKVARLFADDKLTNEEWDSLFEKRDDTWAFLPTKA